MSYCRFENTLADLKDCLDHIDDDLSEASEFEVSARVEMLYLIQEFVEDCDMETRIEQNEKRLLVEEN